MASAIVTEGLTMTFGRLRAVDGLDLEVPAGVVFGFLGTNGAGKTTTIRLLLGLLQPTSGRASVSGFDTRSQDADVRAHCGVLLDDPGLYDRLTAAQNLELYGRIWQMPAPERESRTRELLQHIGLWDRRHETVGGWSLGMRKKLAVARALLHRPPVVFLDEPTTGLDPIARAVLRDDITSLAAREGATVFLTTHDLDDAQRMCSMVGVMQRGLLLTTGSPDDLRRQRVGHRVNIRGRSLGGQVGDLLRRQPGVKDVQGSPAALTITLERDASVAPLVRVAVEAGAEIEEVVPEASSLEDAFLAIVNQGGDESAAREAAATEVRP